MTEAFIYRWDAEEWLTKKYAISEAEAAEVIALHWSGRRVAVADLEREMYSRGHKAPKFEAHPMSGHYGPEGVGR